VRSHLTSQEVDQYLCDPASAVDKLHGYPNIRKLFIQLNTGLPANAAVESWRDYFLSVDAYSPRFVLE
jgi:hypothetical protein